MHDRGTVTTDWSSVSRRNRFLRSDRQTLEMMPYPYVNRSDKRKTPAPARVRAPVPRPAAPVAPAATAETTTTSDVHVGDLEVRGRLRATGGVFATDVYPAVAGGSVNVHCGADVITDAPLRVRSGVETTSIYPHDSSGIRVEGELTVAADTLTRGTAYVSSMSAAPGANEITIASPVVFLAGTTGVGSNASGARFVPAIGPGVALEMRVADPATGAGVATASPSALAWWTDVADAQAAADIGMFDAVPLRSYRHANGDPASRPITGIAADDLVGHPLLRDAVVRSAGAGGEVCGYSDHALVSVLVAHNRLLADEVRSLLARVSTLEARP